MKESILQMRSDKIIQKHIFHKPFIVSFPDRSEWRRGSIPAKKVRLIWYTDRSKTNEVNGAGVYDHDMRQRLSFSLGQYTTVFQVEVYAIKACAEKNIKVGH
jgi:hypothetical protein